MSNVHLPFFSVYQRMTDFLPTLAYVCVIRNSVTGVLGFSYSAPHLSCFSEISVYVHSNTEHRNLSCSQILKKLKILNLFKFNLNLIFSKLSLRDKLTHQGQYI